ncbi:MAG TPA: protein translocase subunit SecD [Pseudonocardiaceae bacterium]|nr:protein translocase subunit SecD [Pseudonocardiaceae bacterium]
MASSAGQIRPGRYLWVFALIVVILYALVFGTGDHKASPQLGIDLKGGTTVTLTARTVNGAAPDQASLNQALEVIQARVNGGGVNGAQVNLSGSNIIITIPGDQGSLAKQLGETAHLMFRPVVQQVAASQTQTPATSTTPTPSGTTPTSGAPTSSGSTGTVKPSTTTTAKPPTSSGGTTPQAYVGPAAKAATPSSNPAPPTTTAAAPPSTPNGNVNQQEAAQIAQAKAVRQTTNTTAQQAALNALKCGPGVKDPLIGNDDPKLPLVTCDQANPVKYILGPELLDGRQITSATSGQNPNGVDYVVNLTFNSAGSKTWADYTAAHVNTSVAVVLDTQVVSAENIQEAIPGGNTQISGNFTQQQAQQLAQVLKFGSLPLSFETSNAQTVSATLGLSSLQAGLIAGGIGLLLVIVYCLFYYRALGLLTVISLGFSGITIYAVLVLLGRWIGYTLDLSGIAGFIISIGITADSFVVFFERLKDEVREGRTFRSAVPRAWVRARRTILASDAVSFLAAIVLYIVAVAEVQGFAFTLGLSTILDLLIVFLVTHPLVVFASRSKLLSKPSMSGLGAVQRAGVEMRAAAAAAPVATSSAKES